MPTKLNIADQRMLTVMEYCIANKLKGARSITAWCELIEMNQNNISNIRGGHQRFSRDHVSAVCSVFGISADYLFGFTDQMLRNKESVSPIQRIKEALNELEHGQKTTKNVKLIIKKKAS